MKDGKQYHCVFELFCLWVASPTTTKWRPVFSSYHLCHCVFTGLLHRPQPNGVQFSKPCTLYKNLACLLINGV